MSTTDLQQEEEHNQQQSSTSMLSSSTPIRIGTGEPSSPGGSGGNTMASSGPAAGSGLQTQPPQQQHHGIHQSVSTSYVGSTGGYGSLGGVGGTPPSSAGVKHSSAETLRKYSIVSNLMRKTTEDYPTNDPKYTISKGMMVIIPTDAIHRDPEIYPDPEKFDPERFTPEEMKKRHSTTWLPFGDGPRNCIGLRFGKMQIYVGLAMLLKNFKFHYCEKTPNPLEIDPTNPMLVVKGGIYLRIERI